MKKIIAVIALSLTLAPAFAQKSCDELKSEISTKLKANGVKTFQLDIVAVKEVKNQKILGSCESGKKKIAYKKA